MLLLCGCNYKEVVLTSNDVILELSHSPNSIPADGVSKVVFKVRLPDNSSDSKRNVILTTTKGIFEVENKNTVMVVASNVIDAGSQKVEGFASLISSNDEGFAIVNAAVGTSNRADTIYFDRSYPEMINLQVDRSNYKPDATTEITMTTVLTRMVGHGSVSAGQVITLDVYYDLTNTPIDHFRNKTTIIDNAGKCVNYFSLPYGSTYLGRIRAVTTAKNANNQTISDTSFINVIN